MTNSIRLEMHVSISTIAVTTGSTLKIADHGECHTSVTRQLLSQTESCRCQALVSFLDFLQLRVLRPVAVNAGRQLFDAVDVKIQVDETTCSEIGEERPRCSGEESRKLRERDRLALTPEVKSGTRARTNTVSWLQSQFLNGSLSQGFDKEEVEIGKGTYQSDKVT